MLSIDLVHGGEVIHVLEKDGNADHFPQPGARSFQNLRQIAQHAISLRGYIARNNLLRSRINGDLARREYKSISLDRLRVRSNRLRSVFGSNNFAHK